MELKYDDVINKDFKLFFDDDVTTLFNLKPQIIC